MVAEYQLGDGLERFLMAKKWSHDFFSLVLDRSEEYVRALATGLVEPTEDILVNIRGALEGESSVLAKFWSSETLASRISLDAFAAKQGLAHDAVARLALAGATRPMRTKGALTEADWQIIWTSIVSEQQPLLGWLDPNSSSSQSAIPKPAERSPSPSVVPEIDTSPNQAPLLPALPTTDRQIVASESEFRCPRCGTPIPFVSTCPYCFRWIPEVDSAQ